MNSSELRIGNLVDIINRSGKVHLPVGGIFKVGEIEFFQVDLYEFDKPFAIQLNSEKLNISDISPITLTKQWLMNFGFTEDRNGYLLGQSISFVVTKDNEFLLCINDRATKVVVKYVHQLQNLYFAFTGEELTHAKIL